MISKIILAGLFVSTAAFSTCPTSCEGKKTKEMKKCMEEMHACKAKAAADEKAAKMKKRMETTAKHHDATVDHANADHAAKHGKKIS